MRTYQIYTANDAGEVVCSPEVFLASDDVAAIERVQRSGRCAELWQDCRRVKRWELQSLAAGTALNAPLSHNCCAPVLKPTSAG
jgi:hypothetical protein